MLRRRRSSMPDVAAVILAAGASRRMGTPKQLLRWGETTPIIASEFGGQVGPSAVCASCVFPELLQLKGDAGARSVIAADPGRVYRIPVPEAADDVDTPQNFKDLLRRAFLLRIP